MRCREPHLDVDRSKQSLDIDDDGLDLDNEQRPGGGVVCQNVDASALPVLTEGHLDPHDPAGRLELAREQCLKCGVPGIEKPIQLAAAPSAVHLQINVEWLADASQGVNGEPRWPLALEL